MGAYGVTIEKTITFRGVAELVSNVYHYRITAPLAVDYEALADAVTALDKSAHTAAFAYKTARVFGPTDGTPAANLMRLVKDLTGAGTRAGPGPTFYPELCAVSSIFVGRSPVKNRKIFVRKFFRINSAPSTGSDASTGLLGTTDKNVFNAVMNDAKQISSGGITFDMVTPRDVLVPDNPAVTLNYAHIRQIHQ